MTAMWVQGVMKFSLYARGILSCGGGGVMPKMTHNVSIGVLNAALFSQQLPVIYEAAMMV